MNVAVDVPNLDHPSKLTKCDKPIPMERSLQCESGFAHRGSEEEEESGGKLIDIASLSMYSVLSVQCVHPHIVDICH